MFNRKLIGICFLLCLAHLSAAQAPFQESGVSCPPVNGLEFICGIQKPEDLRHISDTRWLIASGFADGSGLKLLDTRSRSWRRWYAGTPEQIRADSIRYGSCPGAPSAESFNAHGLSLRTAAAGRYQLFVVNHGGRESIEVFDIDARGGEPSLTWTGCVLLPYGLAGNAIAATPDGTLLTTVLARPGHTYADFVNRKPTGGVYQWRPGSSGFRLLPGTELPGNNGIETSPDGREFYVIAFGLHSVFVYSLRDTSRPLRQIEAPGFMPDNLHWDNGRLLLAGMVYDEPACGGVRKVVNGQADSMRCPRGYVVASLDPGSLMFSIVAYATPNPAFNGVSSAVVIGNELWLGSYQADRIAYRRLPGSDN